VSRHLVTWQVGGALFAVEGWLYGPGSGGWVMIAAGVIIFLVARWRWANGVKT
jgi:hypothetical protein